MTEEEKLDPESKPLQRPKNGPPAATTNPGTLLPTAPRIEPLAKFTPIAHDPTPPPTPLSLRYIKLHPDVILPRLAYGSAIGMDIMAFLLSETGKLIQVVLPPRTSRVIPTGLRLFPPPGYFISICSRASHSAGMPPIFVANAPGIVDPDFTGELTIVLFNGGYDSVYIKHGDFIAQLVLLPVPPTVKFAEISSTPSSERGDKAFQPATPSRTSAEP